MQQTLKQLLKEPIFLHLFQGEGVGGPKPSTILCYGSDGTSPPLSSQPEDVQVSPWKDQASTLKSSNI